VITGSSLAFEKQRERFLREIKALESLRHENIVRFREAGEADSVLYLVMDLIEGADLKLILGSLGYLQPAVALAILLPIANAIAFAHRSGYVRLDLKPGNVQVSYAGQVFLMDLGIARSASSDLTVTQTGEILGTPLYMSPEQIKGERIDGRADIYAYGVMLYEMLTGSQPFHGNDMYEIILKHMNEQPLRPSERRPGIPAWLDNIVMRCLMKNPDDRFMHMEALIEEFNSHGRTDVPLIEIGMLARKARDKRLNLETSRNAITLEAPRDVSRTFRVVPETSAEPNTVSVAKPHLLFGEPDQTELSYFLVASEQVSIGNAFDNNIVLEREGVSRYHARVIDSEDGFMLMDLNSSNGTYLNGERLLRARPLKPRDRFQIGKTVFTFIA
jgi:serine/threonine protein kinase